MLDEVKAARDAAYNYVPRNEGEETHVLFVRALLDDAALRASLLEDFAVSFEREQNLRNAQTALNEAQAAHAAPVVASAPVAESSPSDTPGEQEKTA